jgi:hypothetical protein
MTRAVILEPDEWEEFKNEMKEIFREELKRTAQEHYERPMTLKEAAKFQKCGTQTFSKHFGHLRHVVPNGPIYWYAREIEEYVKSLRKK